MSETLVCEDCEREVGFYFCEHCGSTRISVVGEAQPEPKKPESSLEKTLRQLRGDLTGAELKQAILNMRGGRDAS